MSTAELYREFKSSSGVCTDSRQVKPNTIFFALKGQHFDGNRYAAQAIENGARLAVVDNSQFLTQGCILVDNALTSLQQLAQYHRKALNTNILAITGTNGKTTTKELLAAVLAKKYRTLATHGNLNNQIGLPLTLLNLTPDVQMAIVEMGANHPHDIDQLAQIAQPNYGIITNIGRAHLAGFGSVNGIVQAKTALYRHVKQNNGTVFYNNADPLLNEQVQALAIKNALPYSKFINQVEIDSHAAPLLGLRAKLTGQTAWHHIQTQLVGDYNLTNVMAAMAVGLHFGIDIEQVTQAIENYTPTNNRSQMLRTARNTVILDAYNANPSSMELAIDCFAKIDTPHKVAIIGEMLELGQFSNIEHKKIVTQLQTLKLDGAILIGKSFNGLQENFLHFETSTECLAYLKNAPISQATILLKGSRGVQLEKIMEAL